MVMTSTRMSAPRLPKVRAVQIAVTTTGSAGSASGNTTSPIITGQILAVIANWHASAPAGTSDITVEGATSGIDLYAKSNAVTDVHKVPSLYGLDAAATALTGDVTPQRFCVNEGIKVSVAQSDALTNCCVVTIIYRPLYVERINVTTTGVAGSAAGSADSAHIRGEILGLAINYHASAPGATTDITVQMKTSGVDLYAKSDSVTDAFVVPVLFGVSASNAALTSDVTPQRYCVADRVNVTIAQSDALTDCVIVYVFWAPLDVVRIQVATTGVAGSATGSASVQVEGEIVGLLANFNALTPATADITVECLGTGINIWQRDDSTTDAYVAPRIYGVSNADAALAGNVTPECYAVHDQVTASIAQGDAVTAAQGYAVTVDVFVRR